MKNTYNITIIINLLGEDTRSIKKLTIKSAENSILHCIGKYLEKASPTGHISSSKVYKTIQCLKYIPRNCNALFDLNPLQLTKTTTEIILKSYEDSLLRCNSLSLKTKHALSQTFRNILIKIPQFLLLSHDVQQVITQYKTILPRLPRRVLPEGILSELELDAIEHESPFDLLIRCKAITSDRKMQLIGDCEQEISEYLSLRETLKTAADSHNSVITESTDPNQIKSPEIIELIYGVKEASLEERGKIMEYGYFNNVYRNKLNDTAHPLFERYLLGRTDCRPWIFSPYRLPNPVLFSIFLLLLIKTGWNVGSLGKMKSSDISRRNNHCWTIQGYKSKTDDQTPEYEVEDDDKLVRTCLDLLDWNRESLINLKIITEKNTCLWHGWSYRNSKRTVINLDSARKKALTRMSIGKIKLKDIRNLIAVDTYLTTNNIDDVRLILGHSDVEDSAHYISIELIDRLDSSLMLEFTRRLEATAIFQNFGITIKVFYLL